MADILGRIARRRGAVGSFAGQPRRIIQQGTQQAFQARGQGVIMSADKFDVIGLDTGGHPFEAFLLVGH
ncbi:hypothetical protein EGJ90_09160 [Pseudomonas aeruginosa]|nr:hypothetical protein EGJ62_06255 [Pseudomonas aeruginosa]RRX06708.1 hypothetical protein EGJ83_06625 [Pseudomonas aeruginosa]RRX13947.1 hypothetical protein EGK43_05795 [Pseudomonas aeruginosa]RRX23599.1 hypothetical protein EGJ74_06260 [Pseudomonas aeruginosa]RRX30283.1 hypothetical protein EGJ67_07945 [Pseudomonas aeruginosa]